MYTWRLVYIPKFNSKESYKEFVNQNLIIIGVKGLHRENLLAKVLVCLYDSKFTYIEQWLLGSIELVMNKKGGILYFTLDYLVRTKKRL